MDTGSAKPAHPPLYTALYTGAEHASPSSAVGQAYALVKESLLLGAYPLGARLVEETLAREVGVSRTPVRESLLRLHAEGLVSRLPTGGYAPSVPNIAETRELYEVRVALERSGILRPRAVGRPHDAAALQVLRATWLALADAPAAARSTNTSACSPS